MVIVFSAIVLFPVCTGLGREVQAGRRNTKILVVFHPFKTATLSAEVSGVVTKAHYEMGAQFKTGTPLIDLNPAIYLAEKQKMDALLSFTATALETNTNLFKQQSISEIEFAKAKADLEVAKANVALAQYKLEACTVRAPYPGRVVKLLVNENEWIEQGQPLIEIVDDRIMRARFYLPSRFYGRIKTGQILKV